MPWINGVLRHELLLMPWNVIARKQIDGNPHALRICHNCSIVTYSSTFLLKHPFTFHPYEQTYLIHERRAMCKWLFLCAAALLHTGPTIHQAIADPRSATIENRQHDAFKPERMRLLFRKSDESARLAELSFAAQHHISHPEFPAALTDSIRFNLEQRKVTLSVLEAVRLFCRLDDPSLKDQQLAYTQRRSADVSVAVVAAEELARRQVPEVLPILQQLAERTEFSKSFGMLRAVVDAVAKYSEVLQSAHLWKTDPVCDRPITQHVVDGRRQTAFLASKRFRKSLSRSSSTCRTVPSSI